MGKQRSGDRATDRAAQQQSALAQKLISQSDPTRELLFDQTNAFLGGDFDVTGLPQFAAGKDIIESQFGRARESVIAGTPTGGALTSALTNVEGGRASALTGLVGNLAETEQNRALQLGTFGAAIGTQGLSSAGNIQGIRAQTQAAQNAAKTEVVSSAAGGYLGGK